jgi:hypothetical protein
MLYCVYCHKNVNRLQQSWNIQLFIYFELFPTDTLTSMGVIPQGKEQPEASQGSSTCTQNTSDILTLTDNDQGEDLQTLVDLQGKEPSNPRISRPLGPGIDNKVKATIWANAAIDFGSLLCFKKGRKKFEINEELDVP